MIYQKNESATVLYGAELETLRRAAARLEDAERASHSASPKTGKQSSPARRDSISQIGSSGSPKSTD